jgi:hypothetical protein
MGRQPRSGDIPWLSAHSILNWIGGDALMLILFWLKSSAMCRNLRGKSSGEIDDRKVPISNSLQKSFTLRFASGKLLRQKPEWSDQTIRCALT